MAEQTEVLTKAILNNGHRLTFARKVIIETLVNCEGHITADDLAVQVRRNAPQVGRMTVYRTLDILTELGVIRPIYQGTGAAHYILLDGGHHHHLICTRCHKVLEFDDCMIENLTQKLSGKFNFNVQSHLLELYGFCENCGNLLDA